MKMNRKAFSSYLREQVEYLQIIADEEIAEESHMILALNLDLLLRWLDGEIDLEGSGE